MIHVDAHGWLEASDPGRTIVRVATGTITIMTGSIIRYQKTL